MKTSTSDYRRDGASSHRGRLFSSRLLRLLRLGKRVGGRHRVKRVAVFIDAENTSSSKIACILEKAETLGELVSARIYGPPHALGNDACLRAMESTRLKPVVCKGCVGGKNSVDIRMVVDAMDSATTDAADVFAIASADSDFLPLVNRLHDAGKTVVGFSCSVANEAYMEACDEFLSMQVAKKPKKKRKKSKGKTAEAHNIDELHSVIREGIMLVADAEGWCTIARLAVWMQRNHPTLTPKACGKKSYKSVLTDMDDVEVVKVRDGAGSLVRLVSPVSTGRDREGNLGSMELAVWQAPCVAIAVVPSKCTSLAVVVRKD